MRITETKTFTIVPEIPNPIECLFLNRAGSWDSIQLTKYQTEEIKTSPEQFSTTNFSKVSGIPSSKTITYYTQWLPGSYYSWLKDLVHSPYILINGKYVKCLGMTYAFDNFDQLYQFEFTIEPKFQENYISL